ncbi:MAG: DUF2281 domain-containing protein [Oscillospiraceae bacterium]|nr:DUF2281 domain-containing protein [Oscillospiraceae bacterium]
MANKQVLINEIETLPAGCIDEILRYVRLLKRFAVNRDITLASEDSLARDWLLPEEDSAWAGL